MKLGKSAVALTLGLALGACTNPPQDNDNSGLRPIDAKTAAIEANANIKLHLDSLAKAILFLKDSDLADDILGKPAQPDCVTRPGEPPDCPPPEETERFDMTDGATELEQNLADHVFNTANVESQDATSVTFRLKYDVFCPEVTKNGVKQPDPDCKKVLEAVAIRLKVTSSATGNVDIAVQVEELATHRTWSPGTLALHADEASLTAVLADAKEAILALQKADGQTDNGAPDIFQGRVRFTLHRNGAEDYTGTLAVEDAVRVSEGTASDKDFFDVTVGVSPRLAVLNVAGAAKTLTAALEAGALDLKVALDLIAGDHSETVCEPSNPNDPYPPPCNPPPAKPPKQGVLDIHVAGASAAGSFLAQNDTVHVTGLGLGGSTSTVRFGGSTLFAVDLNKDTGRKFDLTVAHGDDGVSLTVSPSFDLVFLHNLNAIADQFDDIDAWAMNGAEQVKLDGAASPSVLIPERADVDCSGGSDGGTDDSPPDCGTQDRGSLLKVTSGTLMLTWLGSSGSVQTLRASAAESAAQCFNETDPRPEGEHHPFLDIAAGVCE